MADDIVAQLRNVTYMDDPEYIMRIAASEISRLRAENEKLQLLAADIIEWADHQSCAITDNRRCTCGYDSFASRWELLRD